MKPYVVVVRQLGGIGDMLALSPVARGLAEKHSDLDVLLVTDSSYMGGALTQIASRNPFWTSVEDVPVRNFTTLPTIVSHQILGAQDIHNLTLIRNPACVNVIDLNTVCVEVENSLPDPPTRTEIWSLAAGVAPSDPRPIYSTTPAESTEACEWLLDRFGFTQKPVIGVAPISADPQRSLSGPASREIFDAIRAWGAVPLFLDYQRSLEGYPHANGLPFTQMAAVIEQLDAVVAVDSGLLHVAGTLETPLLGLFGSIPARKRMAYYRGRALQSDLPCAPCWYRKPCTQDPDPSTHFACMKGFSGARVVEELEILLAESGIGVAQAV